MDFVVKQENLEILEPINSRPNLSQTLSAYSTSNNSSSSDSDIGHTAGGDSSTLNGSKRKQRFSFGSLKKPKVEDFNSVVPPGFLAPLRFLPPQTLSETTTEITSTEGVESPMPLSIVHNQENNRAIAVSSVVRGCKQFWRAGDYEEVSANPASSHSSVGMDHVRVHPKFLHSNATSHKWALGAFAELLDNALDEAGNGATYVHVDVLRNQKDNSFMLLVEDNGGGMNPDKMRQCMSLGYSSKSKMANTIGQYGNGFKTSTMRLGADVIVFSHCQGNGKSETLSIGLLSYTFLRATGQEDIIVPMVDFEKTGDGWKNTGKSLDDWNATFEIILRWSPFICAEDLYNQFNFLENQGTRIIIYNVWEDDEGNLELDFDADPHDIQITGVNRDEKMLKMAKQYPSSRHFLTYRHSLRSYAAILYLKLPADFRIVLRGRDIEHHDIVNDMKLAQEISYRPLQITGGNSENNTNMAATGTIGFVKDADHHIDVQGFNVYHKNRLIKPFWRVWNAAGSDGRGVIGIIEANFVEPAHDKQGFERTTSLSRLEARLVAIQKKYWSTNCQEIGYAARRQIKNHNSSTTGCSNKNGQSSASGGERSSADAISSNMKCSTTAGIQRFPPVEPVVLTGQGSGSKNSRAEERSSQGSNQQLDRVSHLKQVAGDGNGLKTTDAESVNALKQKSPGSNDRLNEAERQTVDTFLKVFKTEKDNKLKIENQLQEKTTELEAEKKRTERLGIENVLLVDMLENERNTWAEKEKDLTRKLETASKIIEELNEELRQLKGSKTTNCKIEPQ